MKEASAELRQFFAQELQNDSNSTLETAAKHLRNLADAGPDDPALGDLATRLAHTEELIQQHGEHTPLSDFVAGKP